MYTLHKLDFVSVHMLIWRFLASPTSRLLRCSCNAYTYFKYRLPHVVYTYIKCMRINVIPHNPLHHDNLLHHNNSLYHTVHILVCHKKMNPIWVLAFLASRLLQFCFCTYMYFKYRVPHIQSCPASSLDILGILRQQTAAVVLLYMNVFVYVGTHTFLLHTFNRVPWHIFVWYFGNPSPTGCCDRAVVYTVFSYIQMSHKFIVVTVHMLVWWFGSPLPAGCYNLHFVLACVHTYTTGKVHMYMPSGRVYIYMYSGRVYLYMPSGRVYMYLYSGRAYIYCVQGE